MATPIQPWFQSYRTLPNFLDTFPDFQDTFPNFLDTFADFLDTFRHFLVTLPDFLDTSREKKTRWVANPSLIKNNNESFNKTKIHKKSKYPKISTNSHIITKHKFYKYYQEMIKKKSDSGWRKKIPSNRFQQITVHD